MKNFGQAVTQRWAFRVCVLFTTLLALSLLLLSPSLSRADVIVNHWQLAPEKINFPLFWRPTIHVAPRIVFDGQSFTQKSGAQLFDFVLRTDSLHAHLQLVAGDGHNCLLNSACGDGGDPKLASIGSLAGIAEDKSGHLLLAQKDGRLRLMSSNDTHIATLAQIKGPEGQQVDLGGVANQATADKSFFVYGRTNDHFYVWQISSDGKVSIVLGGGDRP
jgi:hypothetical protein